METPESEQTTGEYGMPEFVSMHLVVYRFGWHSTREAKKSRSPVEYSAVFFWTHAPPPTNIQLYMNEWWGFFSSNVRLGKRYRGKKKKTTPLWLLWLRTFPAYSPKQKMELYKRNNWYFVGNACGMNINESLLAKPRTVWLVFSVTRKYKKVITTTTTCDSTIHMA